MRIVPVLPDKSFMRLSVKERYNMYDPRFREGLNGFLDYAEMNPNRRSDGKIFCPCKKCRNRYMLGRQEVEEHVLNCGFEPSYAYWIFHGEGMKDPEPRVENEATTMQDESLLQGRMDDTNQMIQDLIAGNFLQENVDDANDNDSEHCLIHWRYIGDRTSESEREIVERHNIELIEGETQYRERNHDYPTDENLPLEEQEVIVDQVFPKSASKGRRPLFGRVRLRHFISSSTAQSQQTHSAQVDVITHIQEELRQEHEINVVSRRKMSEMYSEWGNFQQWQQLQRWQLEQSQTLSQQQQQIPQQQWIQQQQLPSQNPPPSQFMPAAPRSHPYMRYTPPSRNRPTLEGDAFLFDWQRRNNNFNLGNDDNNDSGS